MIKSNAKQTFFLSIFMLAFILRDSDICAFFSSDRMISIIYSLKQKPISMVNFFLSNFIFEILFMAFHYHKSNQNVLHT